MGRPSYISTSSDIQLLWSACCYFESGMADLTQGSEILAVLQMMHATASKEVQHTNYNPFNTPDTTTTALEAITPNTVDLVQTGNESWLFGLNFSDFASF
jgi:hypothetical protein